MLTGLELYRIAERVARILLTLPPLTFRSASFRGRTVIARPSRRTAGSIDFGCRTVVGRYLYVGFQFLILPRSEPVDPCKIRFLPEHATLGAVAVDVAHLPGLQAQAQQLAAVGRVRVEGEALMRCFFHSKVAIIGLFLIVGATPGIETVGG